MCHSLANIEDHHFKFPQHRRPGESPCPLLWHEQAQFSAPRLADTRAGDVIEVAFAGFGAALRNSVQRSSPDVALLCVEVM